MSSQGEAPATGAGAAIAQPVVNRSGKVSRPNPRYQDYFTR